MKRSLLALATLPVLLAVAVLATRASASTQAIDAISGSSIAIGSVSVTATTAKIVFSETESNGSLRFYYATTSFTAADTSNAAVTKLSVTTRGGSVSLSGLTAGTTYHYLFQGFYPGKPVTNYTASGSFMTSASSTGMRTTVHPARSSSASTDVLGRAGTRASGILVSPAGAAPSLRGASH